MHDITLELNGTTLRGPVKGPWEISSDQHRLTLAATPRGPGIIGWQTAGGPELVGTPHPLCDLILGGEVKTTAVAETTMVGVRQALSLLLATATETLTLRQRLIVFPGSPVIQLATTVENTGAAPLALGRVWV